MDFSELISALSKINEELREQSIRAVNTSLTLRNWFEMKSRIIPNTDERELRRYRQFYMAYPAAASLIAANAPIRESRTPE